MTKRCGHERGGRCCCAPIPMVDEEREAYEHEMDVVEFMQKRSWRWGWPPKEER